MTPQGKESVLARGRKKGNTGKRYSEEQKREILAFVASQGRGGITAAGKKYGVSYIALRRWMNGAGGNRKTARGSSKALDGRKLKSVAAALTALKSFKKQVTILQRALKQLAR
jgi:transposase-like protein